MGNFLRRIPDFSVEETRREHIGKTYHYGGYAGRLGKQSIESIRTDCLAKSHSNSSCMI